MYKMLENIVYIYASNDGVQKCKSPVCPDSSVDSNGWIDKNHLYTMIPDNTFYLIAAQWRNIWCNWTWSKLVYILLRPRHFFFKIHIPDVIMGARASRITTLTIVYSTVYSGADKKNHRSSASLAFVWGIHRRPVNSPHKWPITRKMFPFDDVIITHSYLLGFHVSPL